MQKPWRTAILALAILALSHESSGQVGNYVKLNFVCSPTNDLYRLLLTAGQPLERYETADEAVDALEPGSNLFVLADNYPFRPLKFSGPLVDKIAGKKIIIYAEFVGSWLGKPFRKPARASSLRITVSNTALKPYVNPNTLLSLHDFTFIPLPYHQAIMTGGKMAGFETSVGPLPKWVHPDYSNLEIFTILAREDLRPNVLAATKLSNFVTGRYEPSEQWRLVWQGIIKLVTGHDVELPPFPALVKPSFAKEDALPEDAQAQAFQRAVEWYYNSRLLVHPEWANKLEEGLTSSDKIAPWLGSSAQAGDGTLGVLEGFASSIDHTGKNMVSCSLRCDSIAESAMTLAFAAKVLHDERSRKVAENLLNFLFNSPLAQGAQADPANPCYGLLGWATDPLSRGIYDSDSNGRALLGAIAASSLLGSNEWEKHIALGLLANLRVTGKQGFREAYITQEMLNKDGWRHFAEGFSSNDYPHTQAALWACYLWAYDRTRYEPFLECARSGIRLLMTLYEENWRWAEGIQQERARMLLPLAWLVRVDDQPQHRDWLKRICGDLLALQDESGALAEEVGIQDGRPLPAASDEDYARANTLLITKTGDKAADLLYTLNYALLGLNEAAAATGDAYYKTAQLKLADFLCRAQIKSILHPELDGSWFRAFDFGNWSYWGGDVSPRWGAWSVATGGTHAWITSVFAMCQTETCLWEVLANTDVKSQVEKSLPSFSPDQTPGGTP